MDNPMSEKEVNIRVAEFIAVLYVNGSSYKEAYSQGALLKEILKTIKIYK